MCRPLPVASDFGATHSPNGKQRACNFNNVTLTRNRAKRKKKFSEQEKLAVVEISP